MKLSFKFGNAKLTERIAILNLPSGWACPFAMACLSKADRDTGKVTDGPDCLFRCFGVVSERFPGVRNSRWKNFELIREAKTQPGMVELIERSLPTVSYVRPHADAGDFFNETYFLAWLEVASNHPNVVFYTYTKALPFLVKYKKQFPANFRLTASYGGTHDHLIAEHGLKYAKVFNYVHEAEAAGLEIDHDDSHAIDPTKGSFALIVHGTQPKGSLAAKAWACNMKQGLGYSLKKRKA